MTNSLVHIAILLLLTLYGCNSTPDAVKKSESKFNSGLEEGFFVDGPRASIGFLWHDFRIGTWRFFHHNGSKRVIINYSHPEILIISGSQSGRNPTNLFRTDAHEFLTTKQMNPDSNVVIYRDGPSSFIPDGLLMEFDTAGKMTLILNFVNGIIVDTLFDSGTPAPKKTQ